MELTHGHLLGGRLRYAQPRDGYRTGLEPVLLAASVPAQPGDRILEAGTGAAAGLLCLQARVPGLHCVGVEIDPEMANLARQNLQANAQQAEIRTADITTDFTADFAEGPFDHAFANPPWHNPTSTASPTPRRRQAKQATPETLERWITALTQVLTPEGSLTLILPPTLLGRAKSAARSAGYGIIQIHKLRPKPDREPKLALLHAHRGSPRETDLPATILHQPDGKFTPEIEAVLRHGHPMP